MLRLANKSKLRTLYHFARASKPSLILLIKDFAATNLIEIFIDDVPYKVILILTHIYYLG